MFLVSSQDESINEPIEYLEEITELSKPLNIQIHSKINNKDAKISNNETRRPRGRPRKINRTHEAQTHLPCQEQLVCLDRRDEPPAPSVSGPKGEETSSIQTTVTGRRSEEQLVCLERRKSEEITKRHVSDLQEGQDGKVSELKEDRGLPTTRPSEIVPFKPEITVASKWIQSKTRAKSCFSDDRLLLNMIKVCFTKTNSRIPECKEKKLKVSPSENTIMETNKENIYIKTDTCLDMSEGNRVAQSMKTENACVDYLNQSTSNENAEIQYETHTSSCVINLKATPDTEITTKKTKKSRKAKNDTVVNSETNKYVSENFVLKNNTSQSSHVSRAQGKSKEQLACLERRRSEETALDREGQTSREVQSKEPGAEMESLMSRKVSEEKMCKYTNVECIELCVSSILDTRRNDNTPDDSQSINVTTKEELIKLVAEINQKISNVYPRQIKCISCNIKKEYTMFKESSVSVTGHLKKCNECRDSEK